MEEETFAERNRRRREENAFDNLYAYAREAGIPNPKREAERAARRLHGPAGTSRSRAAVAEGDTTRVPQRLEDRTKEQLYARAQELDISGRSQMTKDELIAAIRQQR